MDIIADVLILVVLLILGVPIPFCFMAALIFIVAIHGYSIDFLLPVGFYKLNSIVLLAVPFFILVGTLLFNTGMGERLVGIANALVGRIRGGLGAVSVVGCAMVGAIAGTCSAAVAAVGSTMIPEMEKNGYPRGYSSALISCASILGQLIPPSIPMILFAWVTWQPVGACFLANVGPGFLAIVLFIFINYLFTRRMPGVKVHPALRPRQQIKEIGHAFRQGAFALLIPLIVLGGIFGGFTTPTEAAALGVVTTIFLGFVIYRGMTLRSFGRTLVEATTTTGVLLIMVFFVMILSRIYVMENVPQRLIALVTGISQNKYVILGMVNLFLIIVGMLMDDFSGTLMAAPLLFPLMKEIGIHPIHFAAIMGTNLGMGNMTPPTAPILYLGGRIGGVTLDKMIKPAMVYILCAQLPVVLITTYWPDLPLFLPRLVYPKLF